VARRRPGHALELDLHGTWRGRPDLVDGLSHGAALAKVFPSPVVQTLVQSAFQMLDDGASPRHKYDEPITVRLSVVEGRDAGDGAPDGLG
jgi:hypothetical protein